MGRADRRQGRPTLTGSASPQPNAGADAALAFPAGFWLALLGTGVGTGLAAGGLMRLLRLTQELCWGQGTGDFLDAVRRADAVHRVGVLLAAGAVVALTRWLLSLRGSGHGGALDEAIWFHAGRLPVWRTLFNAVTSIVVVGMGASLGRESAPQQAGAVFAGVLGRWAALAPTQRRLLVACGAGGGIAGVYNVPFGGALFAAEVLLGTLSLAVAVPALAVAALATAFAWLLLPDRPSYDVPAFAASPVLLAGAIVLGPAAGVVAAGFNKLVFWADARKPSGWAAGAAPVLVFAALGLLALELPELLGNGRDTAQAALAGDGLSLSFLCLFVLLKPVATAACLGSGAPGGLFTPTLTTGAAFGLLFGQLVALVLPGAAAPGAFALVGAGAMLAATTQGPLSTVALLSELTGRLDGVTVAVAVAVPGAVLVARRLEFRSIYAGRIHAGRAVADQDGAAVSSAAHIREVMETFEATGRDRLVVLDEAGQRLGELRADGLAEARRRCLPVDVATARDLLPPRQAAGAVLR